MAQPTPQQIAQQFVEFFYQTFDSNRNGLAALFVRLSYSGPELSPSCALMTLHIELQKEESSLTLGDQDCVQGSALIMEKLTSLGAQTVHRITSFDVQPSVSPNAILVVVTGEISVSAPLLPHLTLYHCCPILPEPLFQTH